MVVMLKFKIAPAEGLINAIPKNQAPLARTFPPTSTEQTSPGTGKFVIFTREETGKSNEWDFIAGAWECIPSRPEMPITKRVEFCHSSWNAETLLDCLVRDDSYGLYPRFVRLQVDAGDFDYTVNIYDINYRTWGIRCVWQGNNATAFGAMKSSIFCKSVDSWFRIDAASGNITEDVPFVPMDVEGAYWLVRKTCDLSEVWSCDSAKDQFVARFGDIERPKSAYSQSLLSPDGCCRAWILVPLHHEWRGGLVAGTLLLQRNGLTHDIQVPIKFQARTGCGAPIIPIGISLSFTKERKVEFSAIQQEVDFSAIQPIDEQKEQVWTIDLSSGKIDENERTHVESSHDTAGLFCGVPTPDYLHPYLKNLRHFGRGGLAPAFLMYLGILKKEPEYPDCTVGVSRDGRHILFRAKQGPMADEFIYGDLQTKKIVRWNSPAGIKPGDLMEFVWVETP
jgi:hypothetical protein